jgi:N-acetylglucosaminyl-diphospho-decaprenol L-rhamnosyltransferase
MTTPLLTIVIVHFNTAQLTQRCILSMLNVLDTGSLVGSFEISVVDNRSEFLEFEKLKLFIESLNRKDIFLNRNCMNTGFGLGCMLALNKSAGKYLAFVNSDTFFKEDCFAPLVQFMDKHPHAGVVTPQHKDGEGRPMRSYSRFDSVGSRFIGSWLSRLPLRESLQMPIVAGTAKQVDFVFGSFMLVRRDAFAVVGGFDPNIFLYYEEMDLCLRLKEVGFGAYFFPDVSFCHLGNGSGAVSEDLRFESLLSMLYVMRKHRGALYSMLFFTALVVQYGLKAPFKGRNRRLFLRLIGATVPQACSLRVSQPCNFDVVNR